MMISIGQLMETDFFRWQGQYGTPDWHQVISLYDCTAQFNYYLTHEPEPPVSVPPPYVPPPIIPVDCVVGCDVSPPPIIPTPVPELSTWLMVLAGFGAMMLVGKRAYVSGN